jgi:hypothetical protein
MIIEVALKAFDFPLQVSLSIIQFLCA